MTPEEFWKEYVGERAPGEFLGFPPPATIEEMHARVKAQLARVPAFYGLLLRGNWKKTWSAFCHTREQVVAALICHLEARRSEWDKPRAALAPEAAAESVTSSSGASAASGEPGSPTPMTV